MAQQVYTLLVQVGRNEGDGLPEGATGAGLLVYASGVDEAEGEEIGDEDRELMARALEENAVIVAQMQPFFDGENLNSDDDED